LGVAKYTNFYHWCVRDFFIFTLFSVLLSILKNIVEHLIRK
jgi:hypothetical protein